MADPGGDPLRFCTEVLEALQHQGLRRKLRQLEGAQEPVATVDGEELLLFASNNYLGLAHDPRVCEAVAYAAYRWGAGGGASRLITGNMDIHAALERQLARFKGKADCVLFSSGYLANLAIATLAGRGDAVFSDAHNHASIIDGCRLSRAEVSVYRHKDASDLEARLSCWRAEHANERALVVTDSVFSMDGDLAPLPQIADVCERYGAMLMVDEAHATGVVGEGGRGAVAHFGVGNRVHVLMGTLSKALGAAGGFLCASHEMCELLRNQARTFMFDTALPPPSVAAAQTALQILADEPERSATVRGLATRLAGGLQTLGLDVVQPPAAIVPIAVGEPQVAMRRQDELLQRGLLVPAIRPPAVPVGTARLRATVTASHTEAQVDRLISALKELS